MTADVAYALSRLTQKAVTTAEVEGYLDELRSHEVLRSQNEAMQDMPTVAPYKEYFTPKASVTSIWLYVAMRIIQPATIVETGCAAGWSSALYLAALEQNEKGHLYTIDLPTRGAETAMGWALPPGTQPGFLVPESLKSRWTLILGDAREELLPLLNKLESVDVFMHDSDHSYVHMMWEYLTAFPYIRTNGILLSDDITFNNAFWDFARAVDHESDMLILANNPNIGAFVKRS
jgi:predicted O-methyltransferase YrrM